MTKKTMLNSTPIADEELVIELSRIDKEELLLAIKRENTSTRILDVKALPVSINTVEVGVCFVMGGSYVYHLLDTYTRVGLLVDGSSSLSSFLLSLLIQNGLWLSFLIISLILTILIIIVLIFNNIPLHNNPNMFLTTVQYIITNIFPYLRLAIEINLFLAATCLFDERVGNWILFIIAALIAMIETLYLQNFTLRKDYFCCKARKYSIVLRIVAIVAYVVDGLIYRWRTNIEGYLLYCFGAVHVVIAGIAFAGYFQGGIDIYRHSLPKLCLLSTIIAHLSLSIAMFLNLQTNSPSTFTINFFLLLSFITFFTHFLIARFKKQSLIKSSLTDLTTKIYFVLHHLECSATNIESDCLILGLIRAHIIAHNCLNPKCFIYTPADDLYDSKKRKIVNTNHIAGSLTGLTKFYLKCLYESAIIEHPNDNELLLQYIEFMYLKLKNAFQAVLLLTKMENDGKTLTDFQQLRVNRLRKVIIEESQVFCKTLYLGKLAMEEVITSETIFDKIVKGITVLIKRNNLFWRYIARSEVCLTTMLNIAEPNLRMMEILDELWKHLSPNFTVQRRWKFIHLSYLVYLKHEKLPASELEEFGSVVHYDDIFRSDNTFLDPTAAIDQLYSANITHETSTCYLYCRPEHNRLIVKAVSNYFSRIFGYTKEEIIGESIEILMSNSNREFHQTTLQRWAELGFANNEEEHKLRKVFPMTKSGFTVPMFKLYKQLYTIDNHIEFVTMLKHNIRDELWMILDQDFNIEAISRPFLQRLAISEDDYPRLRQLNVLIFAPSMTKYTKFGSEATLKDTDYVQDDRNSLAFKKEHDAQAVSERYKMEFASLLSPKNPLSLRKVQMIFPYDMAMCIPIYRTHYTQNTKSTFEGIRSTYYTIIKSKAFRKYSIEMMIYCREAIGGKRYYQLLAGEIEQKNTLKNLAETDKEFKTEPAEESHKDNELAADNPIEGNIEYKSSENSMNESINSLYPSLSLIDGREESCKIVLFPSNNIFQKEPNNCVLHHMSHLTLMIRFLRGITVLFILFISTICILLYGQLSSIVALNTKYTITASYEQNMFMMANTIKTYSYFDLTNTTVEFNTSAMIDIYFNNTMFFMQDTVFDTIVLDGSLNPQRVNFPANVELDTNLTYDQITLFSKLLECAETLQWYTDGQTHNIETTKEYKQFVGFMFPSFSETIHIILDNLQSQESINEQQIKIITILVYLFQSIFGALVVLLGGYGLRNVCKGFVELTSIFLLMDEGDVKRIGLFIIFLNDLFAYLFKRNYNMGDIDTIKYTLQSQMRGTRTMEAIKDDGLVKAAANLNKKIKRMEKGTSFHEIVQKSVCHIIGWLVCLVVVCAVFDIIVSTINESIVENQQNGFTLMKTMAVLPIVSNAVFDKALNNTIDLSSYKPTIEELTSMSNNHNMVKLLSTSSQFSTHLHEIYLGNLCDELAILLNTTDYSENCLSVDNGILTRGLLNYLNFIVPVVVDYLNGHIIMTNIQLSSLILSLHIISTTMLAIAEEWANIVMADLQMFMQRILICGLTICIILVIGHCLFLEILFTRHLKERYRVFREMHEQYIPEFVIDKEKIIRAKLVKEGFLKA